MHYKNLCQSNCLEIPKHVFYMQNEFAFRGTYTYYDKIADCLFIPEYVGKISMIRHRYSMDLNDEKIQDLIVKRLDHFFNEHRKQYVGVMAAYISKKLKPFNMIIIPNIGTRTRIISSYKGGKILVKYDYDGVVLSNGGFVHDREMHGGNHFISYSNPSIIADIIEKIHELVRYKVNYKQNEKIQKTKNI